MAYEAITFRDVAKEFFQHALEFLDPIQKKLYYDVLMESNSNLVLVDHSIYEPDIIVLLEQGEE
ncbi:hypothetical protein DBR06_SOUSAS32710002, partial [Sousa chinensis]